MAGDPMIHKFGGELWHTFVLALSPPVFDRDVFALAVAVDLQALEERLGIVP
jgi:hypothetical protein